MGGYQFRSPRSRGLRAGSLVLGLLLALGAAGCEVPQVDLARNSELYRSPGYEAPRRAAEAVYIGRLLDKRVYPNTQVGADYREIYSDGDWARHVPVMVEEILVEEVEQAGIYSAVSTAADPSPQDIVIEPTLVQMFRMREAFVGSSLGGMRRTLARSAIHLKVSGPVGADGTRPLLLDEIVESEVTTAPSLGRPDRALVLAGRALRNVMSRVMVLLYESNAMLR